MKLQLGREVLGGGGTQEADFTPFSRSFSVTLPSPLCTAEAWQVMGRHCLDSEYALG